MLVAYWSGSTLVEVGECFGVSAPTVMRLVRDNWHMDRGRVFKKRVGSLSEAERLAVYDGIRDGVSDAEIGRCLGRHRGTIGREIARNGGREAYRPYAAEKRADVRAGRPRARWFETRPALWELVQERLGQLWSPEQIALTLKQEFPDEPEWWVSHESIYEAVYVQAKGLLKDEVKAALRTGRVQRRPRSRVQATNSKLAGGSIPNPVSISERPAEVEDRSVPGHWEGDLIVGAYNRSAIATLLERTSRFVMIVKVDSKKAEHVCARIGEHMTNLPRLLARSLTWDRGTEIAEHETFTVNTGIPVYICDPRKPWQRGSNENINGLIRQYLPKGTDFTNITQTELDIIAESLNTRPRKVLGVKTPTHVFNDLVATTT